MTHKSVLLTLVSALLLSACGGGGGNTNSLPQVPSAPTTSQSDLNQAYVDELDLIDDVLRNNHPDLFFHLSESDYINELEALKTEVEGETEVNFRLASAKFVAQLGDQHTYLIIPESYLKQFPFEV